MIGDIFVNIAYWLASTIIGFFPTSTGFPPEVHTAAVALGGYLGMLSPLVPIGTLATCVGIAFTVEIAVFGFRTLKWVVSHVPFIGGKG